ncbi:MAG: DNA polymerase I, partial [Deltaproteobacteria bacterium]|nr:DNA polymerase I [Deltaproteobacteria bacterium]
MAQPTKLVLVDGSWLVFRAYFALPGNLSTATGLHTNAIFGFANTFRKLFAGRKPELGAVVFDAPGRTFRDEKFPEYKATRPTMAPELREQLPWIDRVVEANNFRLLRKEGFEADDVVGTLARLGAERGMEVLIVAGDKDFAQLVGPNVRMFDPMRDVTYDADLVQKKWGVPPSQIIDLLALMGDDIDNIPGVAGIGQKGAADLLQKHGSLEGIYAHLSELKGRQKTALEESREIARVSKELATIDRHVPLDVELDALRIEVPDPAILNTLYRELEFYSLLSAEQAAEGHSAAEGRAARILEDASAIEEALGRAKAEGPVVLLPVFDLPSPVTGKLCGLAFVAGNEPLYVPYPLPSGERVACRDFLEDASIAKVAHDAKQLRVALARHGITLRGVTFDTRLASFLIDPVKLIPHEIEQLSKEYLQRMLPPVKQFTGSGQSEKRWSELPAETAARWAGTVVAAIAELHPMVAARLAKEGHEEQLARDLELSDVLAEMEIAGILVDKDDLRRIGEELTARKSEIEQRVYALAGREFNIGSTKQLGQVLFDELKLPVIKRTKTGYSTDSEVLERLAPKHEIAKLLVEQRMLAKLLNTYIDVLTAAVNPETGRVHATFQQTVGVSGRIISTDPDLQRTPVRTAEGKRIRKAFVAPPGTRMIAADWSQIELRVLAHFSRDPGLLEAFEKNVDVHRRTASQLFHCTPEEVTGEQRNVGKTVNFATIYGQGATALGQILGVPRKEAQQYIDGYFAAYAGVRA